MAVSGMSQLLFFDTENLEGAERALRIWALSPGRRRSFEERLLKAGAIHGSSVRPREGSPE